MRGEQQILSVSSADKVNNAGARGNLPQTSGTPDQNLTQKETPNWSLNVTGFLLEFREFSANAKLSKL